MRRWNVMVCLSVERDMIILACSTVKERDCYVLRGESCSIVLTLCSATPHCVILGCISLHCVELLHVAVLCYAV